MKFVRKLIFFVLNSRSLGCLFVLMLYIQVINFPVKLGQFPIFQGLTNTKERTKCLAEEHNAVPSES